MRFKLPTLLFLCPALAIWIAAIARGWEGSGYGGAEIAATWTGTVLVLAYVFLIARGRWRHAIRAGCVLLSIEIASHGRHKEEVHYFFVGESVRHQRRFAKLEQFIGSHPAFQSVTADDHPWQKRYSELSGTVESTAELDRLEKFLTTLPRHHMVFNNVTVRTQ